MAVAQKEAVSLILDVSPTMGANFPLAKEVALSLLQQKLVFSPRDELGIVLAGDATTCNRLNESSPAKYKNLNVIRPILVPAADFLEPLQSATMHAVEEPADMFDAIVLAADMIKERTDQKKYMKKIVFITNANCQVKNKGNLSEIIDSLKAQGISLYVIGIDFDDVPEDDEEENKNQDEEEDWSVLDHKQQNERVLRYMVSELKDERSGVGNVQNAADALSMLRSKNIPQRTLTRCVLSVGEVKIPVYLYVKTLTQSFPSMHRTTAKGDFVTERRYFSVSKPDEEIQAENRVKAFRYGKSVIPFNEVDEAQMKFQAKRSMEVLGFLPKKSIPIHMLLGGVKAVAPVPDDSNSAAALSAFAHGMAHLDRVMLVRYVWRENTDPSLGICLPQINLEKDILYYIPIPFAEDLRFYYFPERPVPDGKKNPINTKERLAVANMVKSMTVDNDVLPPEEVFNPALQQYFAALRARYLDDQAPIPDLPQELRRVSCGWGEPGNELEPLMKNAKAILHQVASLMPRADAKKGGPGSKGAAKVFWYAKGTAGTGAPAAAGGKDALQADRGDADDAPAKKKARADNYFASNTTATTTQNYGSSLAAATGVTSTAVPFGVTTVDPVGTFKAMLKAPGVDNVAKAIFEMGEVIFKLLRDSIGEQYYQRVFDSIVALRYSCVQEAEPGAFNKFLTQFKYTVRGEAHDSFWTQYIVGKGIQPITRVECDESEVDDAAHFLADNTLGPKDVEEEEVDEDLFDQLE